MMSILSKTELSCALCAILFFIANLLSIILRCLAFGRINDENYEKRLELDVAYLQDLWGTRSQYVGLKTAAGMINASAWFAFCIPVLQTAWVFSQGGKRHLGTHVFLVGLCVAGSTIEAISRLMIIGIDSVTHFMASDFNLSSWNYRNDGIGWRVLEMIYDSSNGIIVWVDAFEWLALSGILIIIYATVDAERREDGIQNFNCIWAYSGVLIGTLCWVDFLAEVMRMENYKIFQGLALLCSTFNMLILMPIWLLTLGKLLYKAKPVHYDFALPDTDFTNSDVSPAPLRRQDQSNESNSNGLREKTDSNDVSETTPVFEIS